MLRMEALEERLRGWLFSMPPGTKAVRVERDPSYQIGEEVVVAGGTTTKIKAGRTDGKGWQPAAATKTFRVSLLVVTVALIITLEAVYQQSKRDNGLAEVDTEGYTRYLWLFLPALAMAGLGLAYGAVDSAMRTLHPYLELAMHADGNREDAMEFDPRSSTALVALVQTIRRRCYGLSAIIIATILGSLLTIAASGLYLVDQSTQTVEMIDLGIGLWFDITSAPDQHRMYIEGRNPPDVWTNQVIQFNNLSFPTGTYEGFAFAMPNATGFSNLTRYYGDMDTTSTARLQATLPAAQARANCSLYRFWDAVDLKPAPNTPFALQLFSVEAPPPPGCNSGGTLRTTNSTATSPLTPESRSLLFATESGAAPREGYFGFIPTLLRWTLRPNETSTTDFFSDPRDDRTPYTVCNDDTQHLFVMYGHRVSDTIHNISLLHCLPFVQSVSVSATFSLPALRIDDSFPVTPDPETARPWSVANNTRNSIPLPELPSISFFTTLTLGRGATPLDDSLIGGLADNTKRAAMIRRIESVYSQLAAQSLHLNFRRPWDVGNITDDGRLVRGMPLVGGFVGAEVSVPMARARGRLVQSVVSTRLLEGLLVALGVCLGVSFWLMRGMGGGLWLDPGSVGARMVLLGGVGTKGGSEGAFGG